VLDVAVRQVSACLFPPADAQSPRGFALPNPGVGRPTAIDSELFMPSTLTNGKICYLEVPALDAEQSADFYAQVFGWSMRTREDEVRAFDDSTGQVSGAFVPGRPSSPAPGLLIYIMVDSAAATCRAIEAHGGVIVQPVGVDAPEVTARFRDPAGNVIGLYQERSAARSG
jgi:uncharacterized protein